MFKTLDDWSKGMLHFDFFEKDLEIVSAPKYFYC